MPRSGNASFASDRFTVRILVIAAVALMLAGCSPSRPPGSGTHAPAGIPSERVRAPAAGSDDSALQVYRLRNSAVVALGRQAEQAEQAGALERAASLLERARELGPGVGDLCERSLRVLMLVHERDGQYDRAWQAYSDLADCRVAPPARF